MNNLAKKIFALGETSSRNDKKVLLEQFADEVGFKQALKFIFNPYAKTSIGDKKLDKYKHDDKLNYAPSVYEITEYFSKHNTGRDEDVAMAVMYINTVNDMFGSDAAKLVRAIVTQKLTVGVTAKTLNAVYGDDFIPTMGVMLAHRYKDNKDKVKGPFIATPKLDGERRAIVKHNGSVTVYTRSGQIDEGLVEILVDAEHLPDNTVYDGELLARGVFKDSIAQRQATSRLARKKGIKRGLSFNVFDIISYEEFIYDKCSRSALTRKLALSSLFGDHDSYNKLLKYALDTGCISESTIHYNTLMPVNHPISNIVPVPVIDIVDTEEEIYRYASEIWRTGGEGVMLNKIDGLYRIKRTKDILKVKHCISLDLPIVDMEEGTGKNAGRLGALIVEYKGSRVGVGSGFSDNDREELWKNKDLYIGKIVAIDTFGESKNKNGGISLNCSIFGGIRYDK